VTALPIISIDGQLVPPEQATVSVLDRGLLYGDGLFEVLRTWDGVAIVLDAHLDRLYASAGALALGAVGRDRLAGWVDAAIAVAPPGGDHRVRIVLTRGPGALGSRLAELGAGRAIVIVEPLPAPPAELAVAVVDWPLPRRASSSHKVLAYFDHVLARELAAEVGADEALRLDADGHVVEGATSNVFVVTRGTVATPPAAAGILPGITRAQVIAACGQLGVPCVERTVTRSELELADELFVTSSLRGAVAVTRLDGAPRPRGPITARIAAAYEHEMRARSARRRGDEPAI
jgi:branched-chain amino acid aminotransferase